MKQEVILIVAPHPDDETLGAGGYILKQKQLGNRVIVLNMTHM
ncbi:MAG: GlcNAc-PI de-N-acetylase [Bacteroidales bacterium]|jgi:LmbE family N-acetylglucosaminyl deacetylase|nr:GlcNAc-PI de-N-acetylase [Bacteroidales bacterium]